MGQRTQPLSRFQVRIKRPEVAVEFGEGWRHDGGNGGQAWANVSKLSRHEGQFGSVFFPGRAPRVLRWLSDRCVGGMSCIGSSAIPASPRKSSSHSPTSGRRRTAGAKHLPFLKRPSMPRGRCCPSCRQRPSRTRQGRISRRSVLRASRVPAAAGRRERRCSGNPASDTPRAPVGHGPG